MRRTLATALATVGLLALSLAPASAHQLQVETPSGKTNTQVLHSGNTELPPHTGALKFQVSCNLEGNPAVSLAGPSSC